MQRVLTLLFLAILWLPQVGAQKFHVSHYTTAHGLPSERVRHTVPDTLGFLWLATDDGLLRFDGRRFRSFATVLPSRYGRYLLSVPEGLLYSHDAGITLIRPALDSVRFQLLIQATIEAAQDKLYYPNRLFRQAGGQLWISQPNGRLARWENGRLRQYELGPSSKVGHSHAAFSFAETTSGRLWVAGPTGKLYIYDEQRDSFLLRHTTTAVQDILLRRGSLWVGGEQLQQLILNSDEDDISRVVELNNLPAEITAMGQDSSGRLYLGLLDNGFFLVDEQAGSLQRVFSNNDPHRVDPLPFQQIHTISSHGAEELLLATDQGLGILRKRFFESVDALPNGATLALADADDGSIYVSFGDVYHVRTSAFGFSATPLSIDQPGTINSLATVAGNLWMGTSTGHLIRRTERGHLRLVTDLSKRGEGIFYLTADEQQRVWFCQAPAERPLVGVGCVLPNGQLRLYGPEDGLDDRILVVKQSRRGRLYAAGIGAATYLYRYVPDEDAFINLSLPFDFSVGPNFEVHDLTIDPEEKIWLATTDGLLLYELDRIRRIDLGDLAADSEVRAVAALPDGSIWISTDTDGMLLYRPGKDILPFGEESGLPAKIMSYRSLRLGEQHRLWVGTAEGIVYSYFPAARPPVSPRPYLVRLAVGGQPLAADQPVLTDQQQLEVDWIAPTRHGYDQFMVYQIDGESRQAGDAAERLQIGPLPAGEHQLTLQVRNEGGYDWSIPLVVPFSIRQPWYDQLIWRSVLIAVVILLVSWLVLIVRRRYRRRLRLLTDELERKDQETSQQLRTLGQLKSNLQHEQSEARINRFSLELLRRLILQVGPGADEEQIMQALALHLSRLPQLSSFELARRQQHTLLVDTYLVGPRQFRRHTVSYDPAGCLLSHIMHSAHTLLIDDRQIHPVAKALSRPGAATYAAAVGVPLYWNKSQEAVIFLYSDQPSGFDQQSLKILAVLAAYLEQIT